MIHNTQSAQISQKQYGHNIYAIIKTMCPPGYHNSGFVATRPLILRSLLSLLSTLWFMGTSNV